MIRLSQFAASAAVGTALLIGAAGCSHERGDEIPASASEISAGKESVTATAPRDGMVYVWDKNANRELYTARVQRGDIVRVDAKHNKIFMNDKLVTKRDDLIDDHTYKVFFDQSELDRERGRAAAYQGQPYQAQPSSATNNPNGTTVIIPDNNRNGTTVVVPNNNATTPPPAPANNGTTVVVPDNSNNRGTTVVVPEPNR
jgi:hypothetical protein